MFNLEKSSLTDLLNNKSILSSETFHFSKDLEHGKGGALVYLCNFPRNCFLVLIK